MKTVSPSSIQLTPDIRLFRYTPPWKQYIGIVAEQAFHISLVTYLLLLLAETIKEDVVSYFFNLNILLGVVILSGIFTSIFLPQRKQDTTGNTTLPWKYILAVSLGGMLLVYYKTGSLGSLSLVIAAITGVIIFLMSYVIYTEDDLTKADN